MKNLVVERQDSWHLPLEVSEAAAAICCNTADGVAYLATSFLDVLCWSFADGKAEWRVPLGATAGGPDSQVTGLAYSLELEAVVVGLSTGELLVIHCATQQVEEVGVFEGGVVELAWSPNGSTLLVATGAGCLLLLDQDWEPQAEVSLDPPSSGTVEERWTDVCVTWRGDGKYLATSHRVSNESAERCIQIWERDSGLTLHATGEAAHGLLPLLAWQPNGRHLYTVHLPPDTAAQRPLEGTPNNPRGVRAAARAAAAAAAVPIASSKAAVGATDKRSAASQTGAPTPRVMLMERNGLQHGGFDLACSGSIDSVTWSCDSEMLSVVQRATQEENAPWLLQVWHRSNWHWYLKYERRYTTHQPPRVVWDEQTAGRLYVLCSEVGGGAVLQSVQLQWVSCVSDRGTAVVVDGALVHLTPLRHSLIPPPMSAARCPLPAAVVTLAISSSILSTDSAAHCGLEDERCAAVLSDGSLAVVRCVEEDLWEETAEEQEASCDAQQPRDTNTNRTPTLRPLISPLPSDALPPHTYPRQLCWLSDTQLLLLVSASPVASGSAQGACESLVQLEITLPTHTPEEDGRGSGGLSVCTVCVTPLGTARVVQLVQNPAGGALVQLSTGEVRAIRAARAQGPSVATSLTSLPPTCSFKEPCQHIVPSPPVPGAQQVTPVAFGLSSKGQLYWGDTLVASDVTSFAVRGGGAGGPALLYCTRRDLLYTVHLTQLASGAYVHRELTEESTGGKGRYNRAADGDLMRAAMRQAMRPTESRAAARHSVVRAVETGAALLTAPRDGVTVVMQLPRGNLEAFSPRGLVLAAIAEMLNRKEYAQAWDLASVNRVDLNLIVDWAWPAFLHSAPEFVSAVPSPADLNDLLFALRPDSVCGEGGLYKDIPVLKSAPAPSQQVNGLNPRQRASAQRTAEWDTVGVSSDEDTPTHQQATSTTAAHTQANGHATQGTSALDGLHSEAPGRLSPTEVKALVSAGQKVNAVCKAVRAAVQARIRDQGRAVSGSAGDARQVIGADGVARALPTSAAAAAATELLSVVVLSHARCDPPELGAALLAIRDAKEADLARSQGVSGSTGEGPAERALRALLLHTDADVAYRHALGLYELPLAFMIINHAQKDPGEYLSELQRFAAIKDPHLRRHAIDIHLERWDAALRHLVEAGPQAWEQALSLAKDKGLLRLLLSLVDAQSTQQSSKAPEPRSSAPADSKSVASDTASKRRQVLDALGDALSRANKHEDAAMAYLAAGSMEQALKAYRSAGQWQQAMVLAGRCGYDSTAISCLAAELVDELTATVQPAAAAAVVLQYLGDVDSAVSLLGQAREWREAMRVAYQHNRPDLVTTVVAPAAADHASTLLSDARESRERLTKYVERWRVVRDRREALAEAVRNAADGADEAGPTADELADAISETAASTILTGMSLYTENTHALTGTHLSSKAPSTVGGRRAQKAADRRTSKARKGRIRQGSPEEEASLMFHLLELGPSESTLTQVGGLGELLVLLGHEQDARVLQAAVSAWASEHQAIKEELHKHPIPTEDIPRAFASVATFLQQAPATALAQSTLGWKWDLLRV